MALSLTNEEVAALRVCLDNYLPELRYDMSRIKLPRDRHDVVTLERVLSSLRSRIDAEAVAASPAPELPPEVTY